MEIFFPIEFIKKLRFIGFECFSASDCNFFTWKKFVRNEIFIGINDLFFEKYHNIDFSPILILIESGKDNEKFNKKSNIKGLVEKFRKTENKLHFVALLLHPP